MIKWFKKYLRKYPAVYKTLSYCVHFKNNYWRPSKINDINPVLIKFSAAVKDISFIQIGSNDGISGDPLHDYIITGNWKGILVEPVPFLFEQLKGNYAGNDNLQFKNCAIGKHSGKIKLYTIAEEQRQVLPAWYFQLASLNKDMLYRHGIPNVDSLITSRDVDIETFETVMKESGIQHLNLIHIDTEGHDYEILKTINFLNYQPEIIIFEHRHLSNDDYKDSLKLLKSNNYKVYNNDSDAIALRYDFYKSEIRLNS